MNTKFIHQFVKNRNGQLVGCVAATGKNSIGFSLCNTKAGDVFNKEKALTIALGRANVNPVDLVTSTPHSVRRVVESMKERAKRYFKA